MDSTKPKEPIVSHTLRSTISNYVGRFINLAVWFFLTPFILDHLEPTLYGLWVLVGSVMSYGTLLDFGISGAITKYVAEYRARGEWANARHLVGTALVAYLALGCIVILISITFAPLFPRIFNVPAENHLLAIWLVILAGLGTGLAIPINSTIGVLRGLQRFDLLNLISIISTVLLAGATVVVLLLDGGIIGYAIVGTAVNVVMAIPAVWLIHSHAPELHFGLVGASRSMLKKLTSFSSSMFMIRIGGQLETKTDEIVIGVFLPVSSVTPYNIARRLSAFPTMLAEQFLTLLLPLASKLHAEHDQTRLRSVYMISTRLTLAIFLPVGVSLIFLAGPFLRIWVGEEFASYAHLVLILSLASMIDTCTWPAGFVLQGMGLPQFSGTMSIITGIFNLVLSLILVRSMGLTGVALGTLIPTCFVCLGLVLPYTARKIGVHTRDVARQILVPALIPAFPLSLVLFLLYETVPLTSMFSILFVGGSGFLVYVLVYLCMRANTFERDLLRNIVMHILKQVKTYLIPMERGNS
jgi:O-antigen/teichoic acid export membrane protein